MTSLPTIGWKLLGSRVWLLDASIPQIIGLVRILSPLPPLSCHTLRVYEFQAVGTTAGSKEATVELILPDDNPANDKDNTVVDLYLTCGDPFGNGTMASCAPLEFVGPADKRLALNGSTFKAQCCVSAPAVACFVLPMLLNTPAQWHQPYNKHPMNIPTQHSCWSGLRTHQLYACHVDCRPQDCHQPTRLNSPD